MKEKNAYRRFPLSSPLSPLRSLEVVPRKHFMFPSMELFDLTKNVRSNSFRGKPKCFPLHSFHYGWSFFQKNERKNGDWRPKNGERRDTRFLTSMFQWTWIEWCYRFFFEILNPPLAPPRRGIMELRWTGTAVFDVDGVFYHIGLLTLYKRESQML